MIKNNPKQLWGRLFGLQVTVLHQGKPRQELKAGTEAETTACWFACLACLFIHPKTTCPGVAPPTAGCVLPHQLLVNTPYSTELSIEQS